MRKKLSAVGNSLGIIIEKPILELLKISRETELEVTTDGSKLIIEPIARAKSIEMSTKKIMKRHNSTFKKLAK